MSVGNDVIGALEDGMSGVGNGDGEKRGAEAEQEEHEVEVLDPQLETNLKRLCSYV